MVEKTVKSTTDADKFAGLQLKKLRKSLGLSQKDLANKLNITFQQLQKYETGANRIGVGRLYEISQLLNVAVSYFFIENSDENMGLKVADNFSGDGSLISEVLLNFKLLPKDLQRKVLDYIKSLSAKSPNGEN